MHATGDTLSLEMQRGYIFDEHLVVCEYSVYCIVGARTREYLHAGHSRAMIYGHGRLPGSAAPISEIEDEVCAARGTNYYTVLPPSS